MIHVVAACFCAGQSWYVCRRVHPSLMCLWCTRIVAASRALFQFHITGPSVQLAILCCRVSGSPQLVHVTVGTRLIAANRSCVGMMSCMVAYHVGFIVSEMPAVSNVFHTHCQGITGHFLVILISSVPAGAESIFSKIPCRRCLKAFFDSCIPGGCTWAMSMAN